MKVEKSQSKGFRLFVKLFGNALVDSAYKGILGHRAGPISAPPLGV